MGGGPDSPPTILDGCGGARSPDAREPGIVAVRWSGSNDRGHAGWGSVGRGYAPDRSEERRVGKECVVRVDLGGRRIITKQTTHNHPRTPPTSHQTHRTLS